MTTQNMSYRWVIVFAGAIGLFASLGLGRFSLGMMLPAMGEGLQLSYSQMGVIGTVNLCGYLIAVLLCGFFTKKMGPPALISSALFLVCFSMLLVSIAEHYLLIVVLYFFTGVGSALSNVPIMALVSAWFDEASRGRAAGICVMGNGTGIFLSGKLVPLLNVSAFGWKLSWIVLGVLAGVVAIICLLLLKEPPALTREDGLNDEQTSDPVDMSTTRPLNKKGSLIFYHCGLLYFLFGFTYVIYVTFFVTSLIDEHHLTEQVAGEFWSWVGLLAIASGPLFGYLSDKWGRKIGLIIVFALQFTAYGLFSAFLPQWAIYISVSCFGIAAFAIPSIISALIADHAGPQRTAAIFGFVTFAFGIGQIAGPSVAGLLAEYTGGFSTSFRLAAILAGLGMLVSFFLPKNTARY